jgi:ABC-type transport system involved in multi-copper enzyme maturation permease subunit
MKNVIVIAKNTFREAIRDRILYALIGFALLFIALDLFLAKLALGDIVMIKSFGLAGIYIFGLIITIFLGASIIYKEIERRTLYFILSKPVSGFEVIMGKFLGLFGAIILTTALMTAIYLAVIFYESGTLDYLGLVAVFFQILEMGLFTAILIFFSSVAAPMTSTLCAIMILFSGHLLGSVMQNAQTIGGGILKFVQVIYYLLPNLEKFNLRDLAAHSISTTPSAAILTIGYAVIYSSILIYLANVFLKRREL